MSLQMKNRLLRLLTSAAFVLGVLLIFNSVSLYNNALTLDTSEHSNEIEQFEAEQAMLSSSIKMLEISYYSYLAVGCIAFVLSIVFGKVTGIVTTVFRTIFLGIAAICSFGGSGLIRVFSAMRKLIDKIDLKNLEDSQDIVESLNNTLDSVDFRMQAFGMLLVIVSIIIFFILTITAIVGLFKNNNKEDLKD
ncbi:MAG: hypothetical protein K2J95_10495 [Lachnospiraceae bacterium]|nr:hypothetical protein [Lachnospiraceae bacterium]